MLPPVDAQQARDRKRGVIEIAIGLGLIVVGTVVTILTFRNANASGASYVIAYGPILGGIVLASRGALRFSIYQAIVARRYLLVPHPKVTTATKWMIAIGFLARMACQIAFAAGVGAADYHNPLWDLERVAEVFLLAVIVGGVLVHSKPALYTFVIGIGLSISGVTMMQLHAHDFIYAKPAGFDVSTAPNWFGIMVLILIIAGGVLAFLAIFFGILRAFFTFFTTVPIGGVWIGTFALICVLSVMSGFESDLREKILGSNAHIQITREDGDFTEWREIKQRVDKLPHITASTPYAVSEVVIAANNNGMNVIIKGIDPKTVGNVTDLVNDLEDKDAMQRLDPLVDDPHDLKVPQTAPKQNSVDPAPSDMPSSGDPIDYSQPTDPDEANEPPPLPAGSAAIEGPIGLDTNPKGSAGGTAPTGIRNAGSGAAGSGAGQHRVDKLADLPNLDSRRGSAGSDAIAGSNAARGSDMAAGSDFGGDARDVVGGDPGPVVDPPPADMLVSDDPPIDYSKPGTGKVDPTVHVTDSPFDSPSLSRRTQLLPGILVGRELQKQTHLYNGEEVRVVSPLSDPSNPDATGTPIPFNRDYRVAGIFFTGMYEYDLKYVYVTLDSLQEFLDRGDAVDGIEVRVDDPDRTHAYVEQISEALGPKYRVLDWQELNRSLFSALTLEKIAMFVVLGIVILVASFSIVGNLIMVVVEKQRQIALLKTLGASDGGVMGLFAVQGLFIGIIGTVLGTATGLVACYVGKRIGIPLNPDVYYIDKMPVHVDPSSVALTFAAGVLISIAATFYPAILAARVRPAAGMRH